MMIKITKYTKINVSVIGLSSEILKSLNEDGIQTYDRILGSVVYDYGREAEENFLLALCFLYSVGKIEYYPKKDIIELLE